MSKHTELGKKGEIISCEFLEKKGHNILKKNFRVGRNEIDIISLENDILVFSEIKTRSNFNFGFPEEAVHQKKQESIKKIAEHFLMENSQYEKIRFDIISVLIKHNNILEIKHFEDAFY